MPITAVKEFWLKYPKAIRPVVVLLIAILLAIILIDNRPQLEPKETVESYTAVRVQSVIPRSMSLTVDSQGTVQPRTESELIPEVSGQVVWISPSLVSGGDFEQGEVLLKIDQGDYITAVDKSRAAVTRADVEFETSSAEYKRTVKLSKQNLASQSQLDQSQRSYRVAEANLLDAKITFDQAQRDLARTIIKAPFTGRIRAKHVDSGQFVSRGNNIATIYATDLVEVRLPIANSQLAFLNLPMGFRGQLDEAQQSDVLLHGNYAGFEFAWPGKLVRTEAEIDAQSRMFYAVVRAQTPAWDGKQPPLMVGLFVKASIKGRTVDNIVVLPRVAMRDNNQVLVVDDDNRLRFRTVSLLRIDRNNVLIQSGLQAGERVCVSPLQVAVEGMRVKPIAESPDDPAEDHPTEDNPQQSPAPEPQPSQSVIEKAA